MERLFKCRIVGGELVPFDGAAWREALRSWPHQILYAEFQDEKRVRSTRQNRYWWRVCIPAIAECWQHDKGWAAVPPKDTVHGALVQAVFGTVDTPLGPQRLSSTQLTTEQFSELIDWTRTYAINAYDVYIPSPNEVPA